MASYIGRRELLAALGGAAATWPLAARAQQPARVARVGFLVTLLWNLPIIGGLSRLFAKASANSAIERVGQTGRFSMLATELVRRDVDLIIAPSTPAARAARQVTTTIPIVPFSLGDPVEDGLVSSLAVLSRLGGNGLRRRLERKDRIPLGGRTQRPSVRIGGRSGSFDARSV